MDEKLKTRSLHFGFAKEMSEDLFKGFGTLFLAEDLKRVKGMEGGKVSSEFHCVLGAS